MTGRSATDLLALPVRLRGIQLGRPVCLLVAQGQDRLLGFELLCGDGEHRFLPFSVAEVRADEIAVESALTLIDERELSFYRARSRALEDLGLVEPWIGADGVVLEARSAA